jgi:hypothetical protein
VVYLCIPLHLFWWAVRAAATRPAELGPFNVEPEALGEFEVEVLIARPRQSHPDSREQTLPDWADQLLAAGSTPA